MASSLDTGPTGLWKVAGTVIGIASAAGMRWLLNKTHRTFGAADDDPDERHEWIDAIGWSAFIAVGATVGRMLTQRALTAAWARRRGRSASAVSR